MTAPSVAGDTEIVGDSEKDTRFRFVKFKGIEGNWFDGIQGKEQWWLPSIFLLFSKCTTFEPIDVSTSSFVAFDNRNSDCCGSTYFLAKHILWLNDKTSRKITERNQMIVKLGQTKEH